MAAICGQRLAASSLLRRRPQTHIWTPKSDSEHFDDPVLGFGQNPYSANPEAAIYTVHDVDVQHQPQYADLKHEADISSSDMRHAPPPSLFLVVCAHWHESGKQHCSFAGRAVTGRYVKLNVAASFAIVCRARLVRIDLDPFHWVRIATAFMRWSTQVSS